MIYVGDIKRQGYVLYCDVEYDKNGWADARNCTPIPFDLVYIKTDKNKILVGWWKGSAWYSTRLKEDDHVIKWRKKEHAY